jgi:hypothetical protein
MVKRFERDATVLEQKVACASAEAKVRVDQAAKRAKEWDQMKSGYDFFDSSASGKHLPNMWDRFDLDTGAKTQTRPPTLPSQARLVKCHRNFARSSSQTVSVWKFFATNIWTRCVADASQTREPSVVNVIVTQV